MTFEQKRKLNEWIEFADLGVELHEEAQRIYEKYSFYLQAAPTLMLSSVAAILSAGFDATSFAEKIGGEYVTHALVLSFLNALNTLMIGCANYWNWQAKAETNKFAAREYDKLRETLRVKKSRMEMGKVDFSTVLDEVEKAIVEVKKQCGPPPSGLLRRHQFRRSVADVSQLNELQSMYDSQNSFCSRISRRCRSFWNPQAEHPKHLSACNNVQRLLDVKIQKVRNGTGDDSLAHFWLGIWETYEGAVERSETEMASTLLTSVAALSDSKCMASILKWQGQQRTTLHIAVMHGNHDLCNFIFQQLKPDVVKFMCVKEDSWGKIPVNYVNNDTIASIEQQLLLFTLQGLCDTAVRTKKANEEGNEHDDSIAQALERTQGDFRKSFVDHVSKCVKRGGNIAHIRDIRGYNMAHIAAEADDFELLKRLLALENSPFNLRDIIYRPSTFSKLVLATPEATELKPDNVLAIALWGGCQNSMRAIVAHHLNCKDSRGKERRIVFNDALKAYVKKMLAAFKQYDGSHNTDDFNGDAQNLHQSEVMLEQFAKATRGDLELSWSFEWLDELEGSLPLAVDETEMQSAIAAGKKNKKQIQFQRACSMRDLFHAVLEGNDDKYIDPTVPTKISFLHYAVAASLPYVVEALVLSGHELQEDSHGLNPYDYLVLLIRLMISPRQGADATDSLNNFASLYPDRFRDLKACFGSFFTHADENKQFVAALSRFVPSTTISKGWKKGQASGTSLHVACLLQDPVALNTILKCRDEKSDSSRLGLRQTICEREKSNGELVPGEGASSPHSLTGGFEKPKSDGTYMTHMFSHTPIGLAVRAFLIPTAAGVSKEVLRLLLLCAHRNQCLTSILQDLLSELRVYSPCFPDNKETEDQSQKERELPELMRNMVNMVFHRNELEQDWQKVMVGRRIFEKYDTSTLVTLPCDQFTFGAPSAGHEQGRWYYEVEFRKDLLQQDKTGVFIGWASEGFSKHSSTQVGGAPFSWSFTPKFNSKSGETFSQLRLGGSARKSTAFSDCRGVGVLIDLQANKIAWRVIHKNETCSWVRSAGPDDISLEREEDQRTDGMPSLEAQFDLGAWRSLERTLMPCMSCYVAKLQKNALTVHLSGKFKRPLPPDCYPAIVIEDSFKDSIVPFNNEFGNSPSQSPPLYNYDCITLVHLAVMQGDVDLAAKLVEKYGALYLPMLNLSGDHRAHDYERLLFEQNRKCVSEDKDSLPYAISESKGLHRRIHTVDWSTGRNVKRAHGTLKRVHQEHCGTAEGEKDAVDSRPTTSAELQHALTAPMSIPASAPADTPALLDGSSPNSQVEAQVIEVGPENGWQAATRNPEVPSSGSDTSGQVDLEAGTSGTTCPSLSHQAWASRNQWQEGEYC
eukprot:TRINITY_DN4416_c0_g2_i6.p1 TRINITY_DN4416_c0_g2~~TRINITY_DN4416_c0_g2_i6.p1  ORF type:complete len:1427 (-),score=178.35 TRINITY_DN4416_c0_g2_i6:72-4181(-)